MTTPKSWDICVSRHCKSCWCGRTIRCCWVSKEPYGPQWLLQVERMVQWAIVAFCTHNYLFSVKYVYKVCILTVMETWDFGFCLAGLKRLVNSDFFFFYFYFLFLGRSNRLQLPSIIHFSCFVVHVVIYIYFNMSFFPL